MYLYLYIYIYGNKTVWDKDDAFSDTDNNVVREAPESAEMWPFILFDRSERGEILAKGFNVNNIIGTKSHWRHM